MRVSTYNIRNVRALDWASLWWRRRTRVADVVRGLDADVVALQEAYPSQIAFLTARALRSPEWEVTGVGRNAGGGGEAVPIFHRTPMLRCVAGRTRWFGPTPDVPGSRLDGAQFPRIATLAEFEITASGSALHVLNVHLDSASVEHRARSIDQIAEWVGARGRPEPTIVLGDFNGPMNEPGYPALAEVGLRSALGADRGATSNGFGRGLDQQKQIDHVFVSDHFEIDRADIVRDAGYASDHYPVVVDVTVTEPVPPSGN